jgi:hypothetical protein
MMAIAQSNPASNASVTLDGSGTAATPPAEVDTGANTGCAAGS